MPPKVGYKILTIGGLFLKQKTVLRFKQVNGIDLLYIKV